MKIRTVAFAEQGRAAVILGDCLSARALALKLRLLYGVTSVIFDKKRSTFSLLFPMCDFERAYNKNADGVLLRQLEDIAEEDTEQLLFLLAAKQEYSRVLGMHTAELENRYIITDKREIASFLRTEQV